MSGVEDAFRALRESRAAGETWLPIYRAGLVEAFAERRFEEAAELAAFAASALEAGGEYRRALEEIQFALPQAIESPEATATLLGTQALFEAFAGDAVASQTVGAADALEHELTSPHARMLLQAHRAMVALLLMDLARLESARRTAQQARSEGFDWLANGLEVWAVPATAALGEFGAARSWATAFAAATEATKAEYRRQDAQAVVAALESALQPVTTALEFATGRQNRVAAWRGLVAAVRSSWLLADRDATAETITRLRALAVLMNPGYEACLPAFEAVATSVIEGFSDRVGVPELEPPPVVTLVNLPGVLAAMEVVADGGTQGQALAWYRWADTALPDVVRTSLEWPASVARVRGLLLLRIGDERAGVAALEAALRWARRSGHTVELALAETQLADLVALTSPQPAGRRRSELRRSGRTALMRMGVDPVRHAYAALDALSVGRVASAQPKLTPREVEVMRLLADGYTYSAIGDHLTISTQTVQVHVRHLYSKLDAHGKVRAIRRAIELGII